MGEALTAAALRVRQAEVTWASAERGKAGGTLLHRLAGVLDVAEAPMSYRRLLIRRPRPVGHWSHAPAARASRHEDARPIPSWQRTNMPLTAGVLVGGGWCYVVVLVASR
jgi:hypothetical protein